jgi:hypothetical protein
MIKNLILKSSYSFIIVVATIVLGFYIGRAIGGHAYQPETKTIDQISATSSAEVKPSLLKRLLGIAPTSVPEKLQEKNTSPTNSPTSPSQQNSNASTAQPTGYLVTQVPAVPTSYSSPTSIPQIPTSVPPTATQVPAAGAIIQADAVWHAGNSDQSVYNGIVRVKDTVSGQILASGTTSSGGRIRFDNVPAERSVDVILLKPSDWQTDYCGDKQTFFLSSGQFKSLQLRLRSLGSTPCEH